MKKLHWVGAALVGILTLLLLSGCTVIHSLENAAAGATSTLKLIVLAVLAIYEVIIRLIPTVGNYSIIGWIVTFLKWLSDTLDRKKA